MGHAVPRHLHLGMGQQGTDYGVIILLVTDAALAGYLCKFLFQVLHGAVFFQYDYHVFGFPVKGLERLAEYFDHLFGFLVKG